MPSGLISQIASPALSSNVEFSNSDLLSASVVALFSLVTQTILIKSARLDAKVMSSTDQCRLECTISKQITPPTFRHR